MIANSVNAATATKSVTKTVKTINSCIVYFEIYLLSEVLNDTFTTLCGISEVYDI